MIVDWRVIPHKEQRYATCGDWWWGDTVRWSEGIALHNYRVDDVVLHLRVSKMSDRRYEWLVGIHELIEVGLCTFAKIKPAIVDRFDTRYEASREKRKHAPCGCKHYDEPGDDPHAPYHRQHSIASVCERALAVFLGVNWGEYDREVESL